MTTPRGSPGAEPTVVYLVGWERSGTTILDRVLGAIPGWFSCGELRQVWRRGVIEGTSCTCGAPVPACPVWGPLLERVLGSTELRRSAERLVAIQQSRLRVRHTPAILVAGTRRTVGARGRDGYLRTLEATYRALAATTGAGVVVDSSKQPPDAALLATSSTLDVRLVHVVRDPRAVAHSWRRLRWQRGSGSATPMRYSAWYSTVRWTSWNVLAEAVGRHAPCVRVRYEDFARRPRATLERLLEELDLPAPGLPVDGGRVDLPEGHLVWGNPTRFERGPTAIRLDDTWRDQLPRVPRLISTVLAAPLLRRYGYPLWPG